MMAQGTRWIIAMALAGVGLWGTLAEAAIKIEQATVQNGVAFVKGNGATKGAQITWEGFAVTTANKNNGGFSFFGILPDDCSGQLRDGASVVNVAVLGCTPVTAGAPAPVAKTGQTTSFASGDDGDLQEGVASPTPRFTKNVNAVDDTGGGGGIASNGICDGTETCNGTITDHLTGLIWLQNANCFGAQNWAAALTAANGLANGQCGLSDGSAADDWRLPNIRELQSLVDYGESNPSLPAGHPFTNFQAAFYWSSTSIAGFPGFAWNGGFGSGFVDGDGKTDSFLVTAVRGGS
jgi:Protein of unknown function (DUF1566)